MSLLQLAVADLFPRLKEVQVLKDDLDSIRHHVLVSFDGVERLISPLLLWHQVHFRTVLEKKIMGS